MAFFFCACFAFDLLAAARAERFVVPLFVLAMTLTPYGKTALAALILLIFLPSQPARLRAERQIIFGRRRGSAAARKPQ